MDNNPRIFYELAKEHRRKGELLAAKRLFRAYKAAAKHYEENQIDVNGRGIAIPSNLEIFSIE